MVAEQTKKARAFKIGIFTVFLVVMVITMLKSVVDSSPILFVKIGQNAVGAIDFTLSAPGDSNAIIGVNTNFYNFQSNPFDSLINQAVQKQALEK